MIQYTRVIWTFLWQVYLIDTCFAHFFAYFVVTTCKLRTLINGDNILKSWENQPVNKERSLIQRFTRALGGGGCNDSDNRPLLPLSDLHWALMSSNNEMKIRGGKKRKVTPRETKIYLPLSWECWLCQTAILWRDAMQSGIWLLTFCVDCCTLQGRRQRRDVVLLRNLIPTKRHIVVTQEVAVWKHVVQAISRFNFVFVLMWTGRTKNLIQILHSTPVSVVVTFSRSEYLDSELISKLAQPVKLLTCFRELPSSSCLPVTPASPLYCLTFLSMSTTTFFRIPFHSLFIKLYTICAEYSGYWHHC